MGSIASHPKVPSVPQTVFVPVYTPPATPITAPSTTAPGGTDAGSPNDPAAQPSRTSNLLERSRGVLSTVLTGFRGVLSNSNTPQRKTLLGE